MTAADRASDLTSRGSSAGGIADGGIEPVAQRHASTASGSLGALPDGWIDAFNTPRYARIHAVVRFRIRRAISRLQPPRASLNERQSNSRRSSASDFDFFRVTVNNGLRNRSAGFESYARREISGIGRGDNRAIPVGRHCRSPRSGLEVRRRPSIGVKSAPPLPAGGY